jgi:hypothetical protein
MIPAGYMTVRQVAELLRLSYETVNQHLYPSQAARRNYDLWPSEKIGTRRLIPKSFVDTLNPKSVHKKAGNGRGLSLWRGKKREEADQKLRELGLDKAIDALAIPMIDLD